MTAPVDGEPDAAGRNGGNGGDAPRGRSGAADVIAVLLLLCQGVLIGWGATLQSPTTDEPVRLTAGLRIWKTGEFDLNKGNPHLVDLVAALPVLVSGAKVDFREAPGDFQVAIDFLERNQPDCFGYLVYARWACLPFALIGGWLCYRWAAQLFGRAAGLAALALWSFCPNVLGHGQLVSADVAATSMGLLACYAFWRWLRRPSWRSAVLCGLAVGLAELSKYVWVVMLPLLPSLWLIDRLLACGVKNWKWRRELGHGVLMLVSCGYIIHFGYGFAESFAPLSKVVENRSPEAGAALPTSSEIPDWAAWLPVPLPSAYVRGIVAIGDWMASPERNQSYLRGEWRTGRFWDYYLYGLAVKLPVTTLVLILVAPWAVGFRGAPRRGWCEQVILLAPAVTILAFVTLATTKQHHVRYVFPALPFLYIWVSGAFANWTGRNKSVPMVAAALVMASCASSLRQFPHTLSFINAAAGGPTRGHEHLVDSNIDWGQDLFFLKRWYEEHPQARPFYLAYQGVSDPLWAGIDYRVPPGMLAGRQGVEWVRGAPQRGWYAVSVNLLRGVDSRVPDGTGGVLWIDRPEFSYLLGREPVARAGYSINIYYLDDSVINHEFAVHHHPVAGERAQVRIPPRLVGGSEVD